jgi:ceramide glucosyltransferase
VETFLPDYNFSQYFQHQLRWGRTVRSSRPGGYLGLAVTFGLLWSGVVVIAAHGAVWSWWLMGFVVVLRLLVLALSAGVVLRDGNALRNFWLLPVVDLFSPVVWLLSIFGKTIVWRGEEFLLEKGKLRRRGTAAADEPGARG